MISLVVSDGTDDSLPDTVTVSVVENLPPVAIATADVTTGTAPLTVAFDGSQSYDPEGGVLIIAWDFGDGSLGTDELSPVHVYNLPGQYVARLTVIDDAGQSDRDSIVITVDWPTNNAPVASPTATPNSGPAPLAVQFAANASDPDGDPLTYLWDFGDPGSSDNTSTGENPAHVYENPGTYTALLTVSDGQEDVSESLTIVVDPVIGMSVQSAEVKYKGPKSSMGKVELLATFAMDVPAPGDLISLDFDGVELFSALFSSFEPSNNNPNVYKLRDKHLFVKLDFDTNLLTVICRSLNLGPLDNTNGVDVQLFVGSAVAIENIVLWEAQGSKLEYLCTQ